MKVIKYMRLFDKKFRKNVHRYAFQCILATLTILAVLFFLDVLTEAAIIAALGASAFVVFAIPNSYSSDSRRLIGGYIVGIIVGIFCYFISITIPSNNFFTNTEMSLIVFGAIAVGISIFIMTVTNTEHPPAAGIALGLVINPWTWLTIVFILCAVIWLSGVRKILKPYLMDLISSPVKE
jgi:CBS-domain-containing membrane protein